MLSSKQTPSTTSSNLNYFILQDKIGSGSFGKVYRVKDKRTNKIYAAKISINELNKDTYNLFMDISREVNIMSKLNHPSVLKFILFSPINFKKKSKPVIITEYAARGSLLTLIEHDRSFPEDPILNDTQKLIIIYGIASAMSYLHSHDILHRDLKPDNILLDSFFLPKVADFGLSKNNCEGSEKVFNQTMMGTIKGTPKYMSPEIWSNAKYSKASDVYAFALSVYEIVNFERPFENMSLYGVAIAVQKGERPNFDKKIPDAYKILIEKCWSQEPENRPTFDQILTELKTNKEFILETVKEDDFLSYIKFIDEYEITFDSSKVLVPFHNINKYELDFNINAIIEHEMNESQLIKIIESNSIRFIHFPLKYLKELSDESREIVKEAESGISAKQYEVGVNLIEGRYDFPFDVKVGIDFLKISMNNEYKSSLVYYIIMLVKGNLIPQNHKKVKKLLEKNLSEDKSTYFYLFGKLYKKEGLYKEAAESFKKSIEEGNIDSLCEYGELLYEGLFKPDEPEESSDYYKRAIEKGNLKAIFKYGVQLKNSEDKNNKEEGDRLIQIAVDKGYQKALYYYGMELEKEDEKENQIKNKEMEKETDDDDCDEEEKSSEDEEEKEEEDDLDDDEEQKNESENNEKHNESNNEEEEEEEEEDLIDANYVEKKSLKYFKQAAYEGHNKSLFKYILLLLDIFEQWPSKSDNIELIRNLKKASDKGSIKAMYEYGYIIVEGDVGIPSNPKEGARYVRIAAKIGNAEAMGCYGNLLFNGDGVQLNIDKAFKYFKRGIDLGSSLAMNDFAIILEEKYGFEKNIEALKYFKMAADTGDPLSMTNYAHALEEVNYKEAIKYYKKAIKLNCPEAMAYYGLMLEFGTGVKINVKKAIKYYKKSIEFGCTEGMFNYALILKNGKSIGFNIKESIKYFKMGIEYNDASCMHAYASLLMDGKYVDTNCEEILKLIKEAISRKSSYSMCLYAFMLENGELVDINYEEALQYYKMAIDHGLYNALFHYAGMLINGKGVDVNYEKAIESYKKLIDKYNKIDTNFLPYIHLIKIDQDDNFDYIKAIENGDSNSMFKYAVKLEKGIGVKVNIKEADKYYKLAIDKGNVDAIYHYSYFLRSYFECYQVEYIKYYQMAVNIFYSKTLVDYANLLWNGIGRTEINKEKARNFYETAISFNNIDAMVIYGQILIGENKKEEGIELIKKAADAGNEDAIIRYSQILKDEK